MAWVSSLFRGRDKNANAATITEAAPATTAEAPAAATPTAPNEAPEPAGAAAPAAEPVTAEPVAPTPPTVSAPESAAEGNRAVADVTELQPESQAAAQAPTDTAVSYTHLTLPTNREV